MPRRTRSVKAQDPIVRTYPEKVILNEAAYKALGAKPGDKFSLYIDRQSKRIGFEVTPKGLYTFSKWSCGPLHSALKELGWSKRGLLRLEPVPLPPVTHQVCLPMAPDGGKGS